PSTTSSSTTPTVGSAPAAVIRAARAAGSIIGWGRPAVYWSSPRSSTSAATPARPSSTFASPASVPPVYSPSTRPAGPDSAVGSATAGASVTPASRAASIAAPSNVPRTTTGAVLSSVSSVSSTPSRQATTGTPSAAI